MEQAMSKLELNGTASKSDSQVYAGEEKMILAIDFGTTTSQYHSIPCIKDPKNRAYIRFDDHAPVHRCRVV
jgi:hypothetical protein